MKIGIIGGAGYTAGELLRLLVNHPEAEIAFVHSSSNAGNPVGSVHCGLEDVDLTFTDELPLGETAGGGPSIDVLFICSAHGESSKFLESHTIPEGVRIIDLAQDFRDEHGGFVYGLPELQREAIKNAVKVANPGCFATAIQLSLLPMAAKGMLPDDIHVTGVTGSTGAGVKPAATTHFSWRTDNLSVYKAFSHQHLAEIRRTLGKLQAGFAGKVNFVPVRGDFARGIFAMTYFDCRLTQEEAFELYQEYYAGHPFVSVSAKPVDLKQAVNTNRARISVEAHDGKLLVLCAIDNLLKGASGQAVQNMNLMFGLDETTGLRLKPSAF